MTINQLQTHDYRIDGYEENSTSLTRIDFRGYKLSFPTPNITAMFLDYSYILWFTSQNSLIEQKFLKNKNKRPAVVIDGHELEFQFFHILEQKMASIIFAYTALESFSNESIPEKFIYTNYRSDKKYTEQYTKSQIERFISLDIKLGVIIPQIMKVKTPKETEIWQKYLVLKNLRDKIIHCKTADKFDTPKTIWVDLLSEDMLNPCLEAKDIITYFLNKKMQPMWLKKFYQMEKETPKDFFNTVLSGE